MAQRPQTYSSAHLQGQREAHARIDGYGRHRHLYLHDMMRRLAAQLHALSWLDYGCGKGGFIEQIRPLGLFDSITGFDPAVRTFQVRPDCRHDLVTCLHVLDPPFYWTQLVRRHMDVVESTVEFPGMQDFERVLIVAAPRRTPSLSLQ